MAKRIRIRGGQGLQVPDRPRLSLRLLVAIALCCLATTQPVLTAADTDPAVRALLERTDDLLRGSSSHGLIAMRIKTARFERTLRMETFSKGPERTLVRILEPAKEKGTATLKVDNQIWNYLPKINRTIKVPASMMSSSWMGSHFTNDDLVQESRYSDDYSCAFDGEQETETRLAISCSPLPDTPVVWGQVVLLFDRGNELIAEVRFFDEDGGLARTVSYDQPRRIAGRLLPTRLRMVPTDKPDETTEVVYERLELDLELPDRLFSLQTLRR